MSLKSLFLLSLIGVFFSTSRIYGEVSTTISRVPTSSSSTDSSYLPSQDSSSFFHVIHFSDFHYDPFFGTEAAVGPCKQHTTTTKLTPYGLPGCDSSLIQVEEALKSANATATEILEQHPGSTVLVVYTGDWMRHEMASLPNKHEVAKEIMTTLSKLWQKYFPTITTTRTTISGSNGGAQQRGNNGAGRIIAAPHPAIPISLGNEDFIPDYHFNVARATNSSTANQSESHLLLKNISNILADHQILNSQDQHVNFSYCGFYAQEVEVAFPSSSSGGSSSSRSSSTTTVKMISLNSLVWAYSVNPSTVGMMDPCGQFEFLESTLAEAESKGMSAILLSHVPPDFFDQSFMTKYNSIVNRFSQIILSQFYGHIHRMTFLVSAGALSTSPVFIGGPITRVSNTNPCYERLKIELTDYGRSRNMRNSEVVSTAASGRNNNTLLPSSYGGVTELTQYYLSEEHVWTKGDILPRAYNISSLTSRDLFHFGWDKLRLGDDTAAFKRWFTNYNGGLLDSGRLAEYEKCIKEPLHLCERFWACTVVSEGLWNASGCFL